jgi:hypothetical protein
MFNFETREIILYIFYINIYIYIYIYIYVYNISVAIKCFIRKNLLEKSLFQAFTRYSDLFIESYFKLPFT